MFQFSVRSNPILSFKLCRRGLRHRVSHPGLFLCPSRLLVRFRTSCFRFSFCYNGLYVRFPSCVGSFVCFGYPGVIQLRFFDACNLYGTLVHAIIYYGPYGASVDDVDEKYFGAFADLRYCYW